MLIDDGVAPLDAVAGGGRVDLLNARVRRLEAVEALLEERAQTLVSLDSVDKQSVATRVGAVKQVQESGARGLLLVRNIRVPGRGACAHLEEGLVALILGTAVDKVDFRVSLRGARSRVDVVAAKVLAVLEGVGDGQVGKVLAAEGHDLALSNEASELVLASVVQGAQLDAANLGTDGRGQVGDLDALGEQMGERQVGILSVLVVLKIGQGRVLLLWIPGWEVVGVLCME